MSRTDEECDARSAKLRSRLYGAGGPQELVANGGPLIVDDSTCAGAPYQTAVVQNAKVLANPSRREAEAYCQLCGRCRFAQLDEQGGACRAQQSGQFCAGRSSR